jgi:hypothetical protein
LTFVPGGVQATEVLCLLNMVNEDELQDDEEYDGLFLICFFYELQ